MKRIQILALSIGLLVIINSCSKDYGDNKLSTETISFDGIIDLNFEDLTAVTIDGESDVDENGNFNANVGNTIADELPVLFTKDSVVMFGYYSKTGPDNTVSIDDMLLFYFTANSEIAIEGLSNIALMAKIKSSADYSRLKNITITSLENNKSPLNNSEFINLIISTSQGILLDTRGFKNNRVKGDFVGEFKFTHSRDGKIEWPSEVSLFASIGIIIKDKTGNVVFGPEILDSKSLVMSPTSIFFYVYDTYFNDDRVTKGTFNLSEECDYTISFTNGSSPRNDLLEDKTKEFNTRVFKSKMISFAVPIGIRKLTTNTECQEAFVDLLTGIGDVAAQQIILNKNPSAEDMTKWLENIAVSALNMSISCISSVAWNTYFRIILKTVDVFRKAETLSELLFFSRDYFVSSIYGDELRYYYNGKSFGYLNSKTTSSRDFEGSEGSEHLYEANVKEKITKYVVTRGLTESTFEPNEELVEANGLTFDVTNTKGDATFQGSSPIETQNGKLNIKFKMGKEDSEFEIKPTFISNSNSYGYTTEFITLKNQSFIYEGDWYMKTFVDDVQTPGIDFYLYEEMKVTFDANGESTKVELSSTFGNGGVTNYSDITESWTISLIYNESNSSLQWRNNYWSVSRYFTVDSIDANVLYSFGGYADQKSELYRQ